MAGLQVYIKLMKTKILTILACTLLLSACTKVTPPTTNQTPEPKKDVFTSIKDAVTRQLLLKCDYVDEDGQNTVVYLQGNRVRFVGTGQDSKIEGLISDNKYYAWSTETKEGMSFDLASAKDLSMNDSPITSTEDVVSILESKKQNCQVSAEPSTIFDIPQDIKFSDASGFFGN